MIRKLIMCRLFRSHRWWYSVEVGRQRSPGYTTVVYVQECLTCGHIFPGLDYDTWQGDLP